MLEVKDFQVNMFGVNTYVAYDPVSRQAMIIDPGMTTDAEEKRIADFVDSNRLTVKYIVNTHLHLDHAFGNGRASRRWKLVAMAHQADMPLGLQLPGQARMFGLPGDFEPVTLTEPLDENTVLTLGDKTIRVIETPGHSPGGVSLYAPTSGILFSGDSLFNNGIGRTDLPGGSHATLIDSLRRKLLALPGDTVVYPGHGPATTIAHEAATNPYL